MTDQEKIAELEANSILVSFFIDLLQTFFIKIKKILNHANISIFIL